MSGSDAVRVVVVDDQALVRQGIRALLEIASIEVVGEAGDGEEAVEVIRTSLPDVVLLDMRMPGRDGLWVLREWARLVAQQQVPAVPMLVLTTFDEDSLLIDAVRAGARGYLLKDVTLEQLTSAVRELAAGGTLVSPSMTDRLLRALQADGASPGDMLKPQELTPREREVLRLLAEGCSNREIAQALHLAEGTVKNHVSTVLAKLGARDRTHAVLRALHEGLLGPKH